MPEVFVRIYLAHLYFRLFLVTDVTHRLNNVLYSKDVAPRMGFVIPVTLQIMVVD